MNKQELLTKLDELTNKQNELQEEINNLKQQTEKLTGNEKPNLRWKPEVNEKYFFITSYGEVDWLPWKGFSSDKGNLLIGNVFKTKEEAEFEIERLKVITELKEYASEFVVGGDNFYLYYDCECNTIEYGWASLNNRNDIYFPSKKIAQQAVEVVGEERVKTYYFGVTK